MTWIPCPVKGCGRHVAVGSSLCVRHRDALDAVAAESEAARIDPTTDRDRWDDWTDGDLERPGDDEL